MATATGMYCTMFTTLAATIQVIIFKKIQLDYGLYVLIMTAIGTFPGIFFQRWVVSTTGKVSYQVMFMTACISLAVISIALINVPTLIHKKELGVALFAMNDYC